MPTLSHNGRDVAVLESTLIQMGLRDGDIVSRIQVYEAVEINALALIPYMDQLRTAGEKGLPNTTDLRRLLSHRH